MRKNTRRVLQAWRKGVERWRRHESISTRNGSIYSYDTVLVTWSRDKKVLLFNSTKYSKTTSTQQGDLRFALRNEPLVFLGDFPRGMTGEELKRMYELDPVPYILRGALTVAKKEEQ